MSRIKLFKVLQYIAGCPDFLPYEKVLQAFPDFKEILGREKRRLDAFAAFDGSFAGSPAGVDEAGRGPLAGPVAAACVWFERIPFIPLLDDSKKMKKAERRAAEGIIKRFSRWSVAFVDAAEIDATDILRSALGAMRRAVCGLSAAPPLLLVDGNRLIPGVETRQTAVIGGDGKSLSIAAASVLAKTARDGVMEEYDGLYPQYGFAGHSGYGTRRHLEALREFGVCPIHRKTFKPVNRLLQP